MIGRGWVFDANCPSRAILNHVTSRWGVLILLALRSQTRRFGDLRRTIGGVSEKMLTQTLRCLETDGFVARRVFPVTPPRVEYRLTPLGDEVAGLVAQLADWIEGNLERIGSVAARGDDGPDEG